MSRWRVNENESNISCILLQLLNWCLHLNANSCSKDVDGCIKALCTPVKELKEFQLMTGYVCIHTVNCHNTAVKWIKYLRESTKELLTQFIWKPSGCRVKHGALQRNEGCSRCYGPAQTTQRWCFSFLLFWQVHWLSLFMNLLALHQSQWPWFGPWVLNVNSNDFGWHEVLRVSSKWVEAFRDEFRHTFGPSITSKAKHIRKTPKQNSRDSEQPRIKTNLPKLKRQTHRGTNCTSEWEFTHSQRGYSPPVWWIKLAAFCSILKDLPQLSSPDGHA